MPGTLQEHLDWSPAAILIPNAHFGAWPQITRCFRSCYTLNVANDACYQSLGVLTRGTLFLTAAKAVFSTDAINLEYIVQIYYLPVIHSCTSGVTYDLYMVVVSKLQAGITESGLGRG